MTVPPYLLRHVSAALVGFALCGAPLRSQTVTSNQTATTATSPATESPEEFSRVRGLFDVDLPKTVEKFAAKISVHPHFGDLLHRSYLRVPLGVRLGVTDHTEVNAELESYFTHGLKKTHAGNGLDSFTLGAKYEWTEWLKSFVDSSSGFNTTFPLGRPPLDLTDGHIHFGPYVTFSRPWPSRPKLTPFLSLGTDLLWKSSVPGSFGKNAAHSNSMGVSGGWFYDGGKLKYTLTCGYWTTALIGHGSHNFFSVNPSVLWQLPPALTFHSDGQWIFGLGVKVLTGPDGTNVSTSGKLRGEFKFMRRFRGGR